MITCIIALFSLTLQVYCSSDISIDEWSSSLTVDFYYTDASTLSSHNVKVLQKLSVRSFLECCMTCNYKAGMCGGVLYNPHMQECNLLDYKQQQPVATKPDTDDYQVMWIGPVTQGQKGLRHILNSVRVYFPILI